MTQVSKEIKKIAIPFAIGYFFHTFYNLTDTFFAGMISDYALAALGLSFPMMIIMIAFTSGISSSANALMSIAYGKKDPEEAKLYFEHCLIICLTLSIALPLSLSFFLKDIFYFLGAEASYVNYAVEYCQILLCCSVFFFSFNILNSPLVANGNTKPIRNFFIGSAIINIILDPLFIFVFDLGVPGLAWATICSQILGVIYVRWELKKIDFNLSKKPPKLSAFILKDITYQSLPAIFNYLFIAIGIFVINYFITGYGHEFVAAYNAATRIEQIALLPMIGINVAVVTLVGRNYGAKDYSAIKQVLRTALKYGMITTAVGAVFLILFPAFMMQLFTEDELTINAGVLYLVYAALTLPAYSILFIYGGLLQGIKRPIFNLISGLLRQMLIPLIIFPILCSYLNSEGVWVGITLSNWLLAIVLSLFCNYLLRKVIRQYCNNT